MMFFLQKQKRQKQSRSRKKFLKKSESEIRIQEITEERCRFHLQLLLRA